MQLLIFKEKSICFWEVELELTQFFAINFYIRTMSLWYGGGEASYIFTIPERGLGPIFFRLISRFNNLRKNLHIQPVRPFSYVTLFKRGSNITFLQ